MLLRELPGGLRRVGVPNLGELLVWKCNKLAVTKTGQFVLILFGFLPGLLEP